MATFEAANFVLETAQRELVSKKSQKERVKERVPMLAREMFRKRDQARVRSAAAKWSKKAMKVIVEHREKEEAKALRNTVKQGRVIEKSKKLYSIKTLVTEEEAQEGGRGGGAGFFR